MTDAQIAGYVVALIGGVAAGFLLHNNHIHGHADRRMSAVRVFLYIAELGLLYYAGQFAAAIALNVAPGFIIFFFSLWLTFAVAAAVSIYGIERRRHRTR